MKKILAIVLTVMMCFAALAACAQDAPTPTPAPEAPAPEAPAQEEPAQEAPEPPEPPAGDEKIIIGYAALDDSQEHIYAVRENILAVAAEYDYVEVIALDNAADGTRAVSNTDTLILQGADVIVMFNIDASVNPVIAGMAEEAGIPIMAIDIPVEGAPLMGANSVLAGKLVGNALGDLANEQWDGQVDLIIILNTLAAGEVVITRMNAVLDGIEEKIPGLDAYGLSVELEYSDDPILAQQVTANTLNANPNAKHILIASINDIGAQGAFAAVEAVQRGDEVFIANHGVSVQTRQNLYTQMNSGEQNSWRGGVAYFLERYGEYIVPGAIRLARGEDVPPEDLLMDHLFIDISNIEDWYPQAIWGQ